VAVLKIMKTPRHYNMTSKAPFATRAIQRMVAGAGVFVVISLAVLLLPVGSSRTTALVAQEDEEIAANREYRIKAAYLYQFGRYVEWPAKAFANPSSPFVIGVLAQDPLLPDLEQIAKIKKIQDRAIQIRRFASPADIRACNILYLPASLSSEKLAEIIRSISGHGVLLVGDTDGILNAGGVIQFAVEDNKIRVLISRKAAEREGLTISAKLLQVARVVD
jgi:hypothetical protein